LISGAVVSAVDCFAGFDVPGLFVVVAEAVAFAGFTDLVDLAAFEALAEVFFAASSLGEAFGASDACVDAAFFDAAAFAGAGFGAALADADLAEVVADLAEVVEAFAEVVAVFAEVLLAVATFVVAAFALREPAPVRAPDCAAGGVSEPCCSD
jgi:hypothetical protein